VEILPYNTPDRAIGMIAG